MRNLLTQIYAKENKSHVQLRPKRNNLGDYGLES